MATFSLQNTLPRLPVPSLEETCKRYINSIEPLLSPEAFEQSKKHVLDFLNGPVGPSLQQRLIDIDRASPYNWLEDNFWFRKAYMEWREPLMINSDWYIMGQHDLNHPHTLLTSKVSGKFSRFQVRRAAHMIFRGLLFKEKIDRQELPIERLKGGEPQCMWQYSRIFSVTRIPSYHCDTLFETDQKYRHIIVLVRDQIYKVNVYKELKDDIWQLMTTDEIEVELYKVIADVHQRQPSAPVGVLSSWHRDKWTAARNHLLTLDPQNRQTTTEIESSLFAVALDDHSIGVQEKHLTRTMFCGHQGLGNGHNRWFDKSITLVVENTGACAFSGEHSPVDAFTVSFILDFMLEEPVTGTIESEWVEPHQGTAHHLPFVTDNIIARYIKEAEKDADAAASLSDPDVLVFDDYGTDWVKKVGRVPPDAYWQMSLQLAYYRIHHKLTPVYETASTRKYLHGRTETIRSCSMDSKAFLETFENPNATTDDKYRALSKATSSHRDYTAIASEGYGCDRHLLALSTLNADHYNANEPIAMHAMFTDPIFAESQTWRLSTSNLHAGIRLRGTGFGTVLHFGYGINYMAAPTLVKFSIETKKVPETVTTAEFIKVLTGVLRDMKTVCKQMNHPKL